MMRFSVIAHYNPDSQANSKDVTIVICTFVEKWAMPCVFMPWLKRAVDARLIKKWR
jgi:hypothetical protein